MEHYVTLFDSLFLPQGLALHMSMKRYAGNYVLWVLCIDDTTYEVLSRLDLPNMRLLLLSKVETTELKRIRGQRSTGEYCWTLTPFAPRFVFEADPAVERVTYIDADMWLRKSPAPIFREFEASGKAVLITDHGYSPEHDQTATSGQFCVQFMTFHRTRGEKVRRWWEERCVEWCYARFEDGKFGDQKYLDEWPSIFPDEVHILERKEFALAPWNATRFPYSEGIFWHFHGLRLLGNGRKKINRIGYGNYPLPKCTIENIYRPYSNDLITSIGLLNTHGVITKPQLTPNILYSVLIKIKWLANSTKKIFLSHSQNI